MIWNATKTTSKSIQRVCRVTSLMSSSRAGNMGQNTNLLTTLIHMRELSQYFRSPKMGGLCTKRAVISKNDSPDMDENILKFKLTVCILTSLSLYHFKPKVLEYRVKTTTKKPPSQYFWSSLYTVYPLNVLQKSEQTSFLFLLTYSVDLVHVVITHTQACFYVRVSVWESWIWEGERECISACLQCQ